MATYAATTTTPVPRVALAARTGLYVAMWISSLLTMALAAASLQATYESFYGFGLNATVELIASGAIAVVVLPLLHFLFHRRPSSSPLASVTTELIVLTVLFALFLGGAAATAQNIRAISRVFGSYDDIFPLTAAAMAFAWVTWFLVGVTITLVLVLASGAQKRGGSGVWGRQLGVGADVKGRQEMGTAGGPRVEARAGTAQVA